METVYIYPLTTLRPSLRRRLYEAQQEASRVWTLCRDRHLAARQRHTHWPTRDELQQATKGQFALHSQAVQMICHQFLANVDTAREVRQTNRKIRYPYKDKRFFPLYWPAQAVSRERGRLVLPMGRGRRSLVFKLDLPEQIGGCKLVWKDGYELHVSVPVSPAETARGQAQATVDLGEIHQAAVTTTTGAALVVSGRGIRSLKRQRHMALGQLARKRKRCKPGSRRSRRLWAVLAARKAPASDGRSGTFATKARAKSSPSASSRVWAACSLAILTGCASRTAGAITTSAWQAWEYGRDIAYLTYKAKHACIESFTGSERGTSSQCPVCGWKQKVKGRQWRCRNPECSFQGHRDVVGSVNMHPLAFGTKIPFPARITYQRAGPVRVLAWSKQPCQVPCSPPVVGARTRATRRA